MDEAGISRAACARMVAQGDADRWRAAMTAPPEDRDRLLALYAFNLEVARAPWASAEAMIGQMRLQFWHDLVTGLERGEAPVAHEVATPLARMVFDEGVPTAPMRAMIAARQNDLARAPFDDADALIAYLDDTAGSLMWLAARALGAPQSAEPVARDMGTAQGLARWLEAVPELEARGRLPLADGRPEAVAALARQGLDWIARARGRRGAVPARAAPALLAGWRAAALLDQAARAPERVAQGGLVQSEFARRGGLLLRAATGRW